jgi:hypothetical protein
MRLSEIYGTGMMKANKKGRIDIEGEPRTLVAKIASVRLHVFDPKPGETKGDQQVVIGFDDDELPELGLNKTNATAIATFSNCEDPDDWVGVRVEITTQPQQRSTTGYSILVREPEPDDKPAAKAPAKKEPPQPTNAKPDTEQFGPKWAAQTQSRLNEAGGTIEELRGELVAAGVEASQIRGELETWPRAIVGKIPGALDKIKGGGDDDVPY